MSVNESFFFFLILSDNKLHQQVLCNLQISKHMHASVLRTVSCPEFPWLAREIIFNRVTRKYSKVGIVKFKEIATCVNNSESKLCRILLQSEILFQIAKEITILLFCEVRRCYQLQSRGIPEKERLK